MTRPANPLRVAAIGAALLFSVLFGGCVAGPSFHRPRLAPPARYRPSSESASAAARQSPAGVARYRQRIERGGRQILPWWTLFRSPQLDALIRQALSDNHDLAADEAAVAQARQMVAVAGAGRYPQVAADASGGRQKYGANFLGPEVFPPFSYVAFGANVSYRLDYIGAVARTLEERRALVRYRESELQAARLVLSGEVASQAVAIAATRAEIGAVKGLLAEDRANLRLVRSAVEAGSVARLDVLTARTQLASDQTLLPPLYQRLAVARHALSVLLARPPAQWSAPDPTLRQFTLPRSVPVAVPSQLVRRRPDILAAQAQLHAATAAVGIATANLYPRIDLTASLTEAALRPSALFGPGSLAWSLIGGVTEPLFDGGRLRAERRAALDVLNERAQAYQQVVLVAFRQVADALDALRYDADLLAAQAHARALSRSRLALERDSYRAGNTGLLPVLDAERQRERADLGLLQAEERQYLDTIRLLLASGGPLTRTSYGKASPAGTGVMRARLSPEAR